MLKLLVLLAAEILLVNSVQVRQIITNEKPIKPDSQITEAPVNPADHGFIQAGSKWYKQVDAALNWADCQTACDDIATPQAQMVTLADATESVDFDALAFDRRTKRGGVPFGGIWIGLRQTGQFDYEWVNGITFSITDPTDGSATGFHEITSTTPTALKYALDSNGRDGRDCIKIYAGEWYEEDCSEEIICYCEAILP